MVSSNTTNHLQGYSVTQTRSLTSTFLFGTCASWMLLSFIIVQAFSYFRHFKKEAKFLNSIVYIVILLQLVEIGLQSYEAYAIDSLGWGDPDILSHHSVTLAADIPSILTSLTAFIVQCFFIWRIWTFSVAFIRQSKIKIFVRLFCAVIALVSGLSLGAGLTIGISSLRVNAIPQGYVIPQWYRTVVVLFCVSSAVADIAITTCMMVILLHAKAGSYLGETRDLLSRLIRLVLQTGLLTTSLALITMSLFLRNLGGIYSLTGYMVGKSYAISLLANLNARKRSSVSAVHGSDIDQAVLATKLSTVIFSPANRHAVGVSDREDSDSFAVSLPVHSVLQTYGQNGSIFNANVAGESDRGIGANSDTLNLQNLQ